MERCLSSGGPDDFVAAGLLALALGLSVWRWHLPLAAAGIPLARDAGWYASVRCDLLGHVLPTSVGRDIARALLVARRSAPDARSATTVIADRGAALVGVVGLALVAFLRDRSSVPTGARTFLGLVTAALLLTGAVAAAALFHGPRAPSRLVPRRLRATAFEPWSLLRTCAESPGQLFAVIISSVAFQALVALEIVMLGRAIGVDLSFMMAEVTLALVEVATLISVSIGGFGVREWSYVVLLAGASVNATDATLISVLAVAPLFLAALSGAPLLARGGLAPALQPLASP